ncbi:hypothetical protein LP421_08045 [Rhizobium sp. RCAM05350]|nr:hypothetical protein LP421_08045 [Rhizobium sp. RCAM05350]
MSDVDILRLRTIRDEWCATRRIPLHDLRAIQALSDLVSWHRFGIHDQLKLREMLDVG